MYTLCNVEHVAAGIQGSVGTILGSSSTVLNDLSHTSSIVISTSTGYCGTQVAQLVEALRYKPGGRGFDP